MIFFLILYIHVLACLWFTVVDNERVWVPNMDFIEINKAPPAEFEIYYATIEYKYLKSYFTAIYLFGLGECTPRTTFELNFASVIMLISAMVNAQIIGTMAVLV